MGRVKSYFHDKVSGFESLERPWRFVILHPRASITNLRQSHGIESNFLVLSELNPIFWF